MIRAAAPGLQWLRGKAGATKFPKGHSCTISIQNGNLEGKRPYTPARGPSTDASPGAGWGWWVVTGESRGLLGGAGAPYLAVGRRGGLGFQLPAASKEKKRKR